MSGEIFKRVTGKDISEFSTLEEINKEIERVTGKKLEVKYAKGIEIK